MSMCFLVVWCNGIPIAGGKDVVMVVQRPGRLGRELT